MRSKAQALIAASFIIALLIVLLAFSVSSLNMYTIKEDLDLKAMLIYYFYTQALAYATQNVIDEYGQSMVYRQDDAVTAAHEAESIATAYLNSSYYKARSLTKIDLSDLTQIEYKIKHNAARGNASKFDLEVTLNSQGIDLMTISYRITSTRLDTVNGSIQPFYIVKIRYDLSIFIKQSLTLNSLKIKVNVISDIPVLFSSYIRGNEIVVIMDPAVKEKAVIILEDERGIVAWLLA